MQILEDAKLVGLSTERLLSIKKELHKVVGRRRHDVDSIHIETSKEDYDLYHKYADFLLRVKDILDTREHIEPKHKMKHDHDKRARRSGRDNKRNY